MITKLHSTSELVPRLQYSTLSVVLFTALWSGENELLRQKLEEAQQFAQCNVSIQYYELSVNLKQLNSVPSPTANIPGSFWSKWREETILHPSKFDQAARNITTDIPWLPCIRYFIKDRYSVVPITHTDSFDLIGLSSQIETICNSLTKDYEQIDSNPTTTNSENKFTYNFSRLKRYITPLSRDSFASHIHQREPYTGRGLLLFIGSTLSNLQSSHINTWDTISEAISKLNNRVVEQALPTTHREWFASIVDKNEDNELAQRNGISKDTNETQILLIDPQHDSIQLHLLPSEIPTDEAIKTLVQFETTTDHSSIVKKRKTSRKVIPSSKTAEKQKLMRLLSYFDGTSPMDKYFAPDQCFLSLSDILNSRFDRPAQHQTELWLFVMDLSCAFCQRILPYVEEFKEAASNSMDDVHVLSVMDVDILPQTLDAFVQGFPTVLRLRKYMKWQIASEYVGSINLSHLRRLTKSDQCDPLMMINSS